MKTFKEFMNEEYSRGCLMCTFTNDEPIRAIQATISKDALDSNKNEENGDITNGMQNHLHMSILYGLENDVDINELVPLLSKYRGMILNISEIDHFENDSNVCVLKVESNIVQLHYDIREKFKVDLTFKDYKPHITLAYLKPDHLCMTEIEPFQLRVKDFVFSNSEGTHKII